MKGNLASQFLQYPSPFYSISRGVRYGTLHKKISHPSLFIYFFATPPIKPKVGQQIGGRLTNSKPPRPIIMVGQLETLINSQMIFLTFFYMCSF